MQTNAAPVSAPMDKQSKLHWVLLFIMVVAAFLYMGYLMYLLMEDKWSITALLLAIAYVVFMCVGICIINVVSQVKSRRENEENKRLLETSRDVI